MAGWKSAKGENCKGTAMPPANARSPLYKVAVCPVSLMTHCECCIDHPFLYHVIGVGWEPSTLQRYRHWVPFFKLTFWRLTLSTPKFCHMDLWLARLVLTHHHLHWHQLPSATFLYIFGGFCVYVLYLCRPSEASTRYCVIPGGYPPQGWQSLPCAGEKLDLNPGLLICSQVRYHWATSPPNITRFVRLRAVVQLSLFEYIFQE
jgi:hypothetical protein